MEHAFGKINVPEATIQIINTSSARNVISVVQIVPDLHNIIVQLANIILS